MHLKTRTWVLLGLGCFIVAGYFWQLGNERAPQAGAAADNASAPALEPVKELGALNYARSYPLLSTRATPPAGPTNTAAAPTNDVRASLLAHRLANTAKSLQELMASDQAVLLRNALIDTASGKPLNIPPHLKADGDPGSYIVQARGPLNNAFRAQLSAAGAAVISYIPNNAYLVRVNEAGANRLRALPQTQSVLPWEPYFKLDLRLLALAVKNQPLPEGETLGVLVFPGEREAGIKALESLGAAVLGEDRSPFGHQLIVQAPADSLPALAKLSLVQSIEPRRHRQLANDLSRVRAAVARDTIVATNYLGLTGTNVMVNINDTGVDGEHPDLTGRVFGEATNDYSGHGTHVAGTIASTGLNGPPGTNAPGSTNGASFRGMAPGASLFTLPIDLVTGPFISDAYLQETAARTNAFISNNSWGYEGLNEYDLSAASYDAAVRDALPDETGSQPLLFVFAAGNSGGGDPNGSGGAYNSIISPGTAKNVITVGASENLRSITNEIIRAGQTNQGLFADTDSDDQVAGYSSRGNVGVGIEGQYGRFKPDLVAPGTFVVSCRSKDWTDPEQGLVAQVNRRVDQYVKAKAANFYQITVSDNATGLVIRTLPNRKSARPFPALNIHTNVGAVPAINTTTYADTRSAFFPVTPGTWYYAIVNTNTRPVNYDLQTVLILTNDPGNYFDVLKALNDPLKPYYRFDSGTSVSAPVVSGALALMQEMFEQRLERTNSPALMKALLINGARSLACSQCPGDKGYSLQVRTEFNYQGWGMVDLTNSIPPALAGGSGTENTWPVVMLDQDPARALATGQSHTYQVNLTYKATLNPLRVTLVWTDPPGNPAVGVKLVNDLDLVVSNNIGGQYYIGNNIPAERRVNDGTYPGDTNAPPFDLVNNVENVFIDNPLSTSYTITVHARRVNVNAVTTQTNGVLQDYALVISSGNTRLTNVFVNGTTVTNFVLAEDPGVFVKTITNGVPLLNERVGANSPLIDPVPNNGNANQWNFYVFNNNENPNFTNVAIVTFLPPNLSIPRIKEADIDLYVSVDPALTNLDANAIDRAWKSRTRGGTEFVALINEPVPRTYYIGVKSEDQQAAEYALYAMATDQPFGGRDENGNIRLTFFTTPQEIKDGSPESPQAIRLMAFVPEEDTVRRVILTNTVTHQDGGDLLGDLSHGDHYAVLNNHRFFEGSQTWVYDDSGEGDDTGCVPTDGPGSLRDFENDPAQGMWLFTMIDNASAHTGRVDRLVGIIEPQTDLTNANGLTLTVAGGQWRFATVDVPVGVTNMIVHLYDTAYQFPLDLFIRRGDRPDATTFDKHATIPPTGGSLAVGRYDLPPLQPGRYYIGVFNPNSGPVKFNLKVEFQYDLAPSETAYYVSSQPSLKLVDDALTNGVITVTNDRVVADVKVGVRIEHPRVSDLVLHLVSPQGTRILLSENRGGLEATNYGYGAPVTNFYTYVPSGDFPEYRTNMAVPTMGVVKITYQFYGIPDTLRIYYEGIRIFDSGLVSGSNTFSIAYGPGISTNLTLVVNEGNNLDEGTHWALDAMVTGPWNYATFTDKPTLAGPIKFANRPYLLTNAGVVLVLSNDFEGVTVPGTNFPAQTTFVLNESFDNWEVLTTNGVAVLCDTNLPAAGSTTNLTYTGSNCLALSYGAVRLPLTNLIPDHDYILTFAHRKVSSSPTQNVDVVVDCYANIYYGLNLPNPPENGTGNWPIPVPKLRFCPGQEAFITAPSQAEGDTNQPPFQGSPVFGLAGCFSFNPNVLDWRTVASAPFYIGTNAVVHAPTDPGDYYLFLGINVPDYNLVAGPTNCDAHTFSVTSVWQHCQYADAEYSLGNMTVPLVGEAQWKTERLRFTANPMMTNLTLRPGLNYTMLFDSFRIYEAVSTTNFLSEEPMAPLQGELAMGDWKLEVLDNRAGPLTAGGTNDTGTLCNWSLSFVFADTTAVAIPLTNGVDYVGTVSGDQIRYFTVAVPYEVFRATNRIPNATGSGVELLYSPTGLPIGNSPPDPMPPVNPLVLTRQYPPGAELPLGQHYYLGVRNVDPAETNAFTIRAEFDTPITPLTNGITFNDKDGVWSFPAPLRSVRDNTSLAVMNMDYYYFDIPPVANGDEVVSATFHVESAELPWRSADGNPQLVLRRALPVVNLFPRPTFFDYESTEQPPAQDFIIVNSNSLPVKLSPGRWYLGVYSATDSYDTSEYRGANYAITARYATAPLFRYTNLIDGVPVDFQVGNGNLLTNFYRFVSDQTNAAVVFSIYATDGDADLIIKRSDLPSLDLHDFSYLKVGPQDSVSGTYEAIPLRTNIFIPHLNATNWFLAVANRDRYNASVKGRVCVRVFPYVASNLGCEFNVDISFRGTYIEIYWNTVPGTTYQLETTSDFITWTPVGDAVSGDGGQRIVPVPNVAPPGTMQFFRVVAY